MKTASFTLCNDIVISRTYKIKENDVILNVEIRCEYNTPIGFTMQKLINGTEYEYRTITKEILASTNNHKFNFEICFDDVDNNEYLVSISDYWSTIDFFNLTVNYTPVIQFRNIIILLFMAFMMGFLKFKHRY